MKVETFSYSIKNGWAIEKFPNLDSEQTLVLVFAAPEIKNDLSPLMELCKHYPKSHVIGCSGAGEILGRSILDGGMSLAVVKFDKTQLKTVKVKVSEVEDSFDAGKYVVDQLRGEGLKGIMVLSDGLNVNGSLLVQGLNTIDDNKVVITGGLAGDGDRFQETWTILNGEIEKNYVVAIGFYGDEICFGSSSKGWWTSFGTDRLITRSKSNILYELSDRPALPLYKEYLGDRSSGLPATGLLFPLAIRENKKDSDMLVRTILGIDEKTQSLIFAGDMPEGYVVRLMHASVDRLIDHAGDAAADSISKMIINDHQPVLAVAISCIGRRLAMRDRAEEEVEAALDFMPIDTKQLGFYSYGELSPMVPGVCDLHNQTMTLTTISERVG